MKPSGPGLHALHARSDIGRISRTVVPSVPPGTSSAPTRQASSVRAQQHLEAAPAVVDRLAQRHRHRPVGQRLAVDLDGLADAGVVEVLVRDRRMRRGRHVADARRPLGRVAAACGPTSLSKRGLAVEPVRRPALRRRRRSRSHRPRSAPSSASVMPGVSCGTARRRWRVPHQGLARWRDRAGSSRWARPGRASRCAACRNGRSSRSRGISCSSTWISANRNAGVGLGLDRHPLRRAGAGDRQVRLDLHALHAAHARVGMAPDADHAARGLDVGAAGDQVVARAACRARR